VRVGMFMLLTKKNAASRAFGYEFAPRLRAAGVETTLLPPSSVRAFELLCERRRFSTAAKALYWYGLVLPSRLLQIARSGRYDAIFIQRGVFRYNSSPWLEALLWRVARSSGAGIVYHLDDALYLHADPRHYQRRIAMADLVVTGNADIAAYARRWNSNVAMFDGAVDTAYYVPGERRRTGAVTIGWAGSNTAHVDPVISAIRRLPAGLDARLKIVGPVRARSAAWDRIEYARWTLEHEIEQLQSFDVGVMPLEDTAYNRAKEGFKLKQYMAVGIPVVASPVGKNVELVQEGVNGFLARTEDEWVEKLTLLARDPELRARMGAAGRRMVEERYSLDVATPRLLELLRGVVPAQSRREELAA
jgi:glycosyltransferase involved in cell wall biosynthesis